MVTIFSKIIKGEIPSSKVYEDENHLAFLDISPFEKGHTLVIPKKEYDNISDMPEGEYLELQRVVLKLVKNLREKLGVKIGTLVYGMDVPHVHVHIFPITDNVEIFDFNRVKKYSEGEAEKYLEKLKIIKQ
ncbi:MAG: HIT domain-containing protein [Candidatus Woesearchaeota archaeon]|jgi:histidine triad (HIT) family protein|nr:HIT domain-containing protein [Candidatus Woesearchaeota archaeon]